ncbi:hypothetical protein FRB93_003838 [Tulasnella sp. JGI-2019a]|nr:hypothetical protein FRB93_003838 [Tulasnella sp. JGI-2019a]
MRGLWLAALGGGGLLAHAQSSPPVNVWLTSSWNATNLLAEIIETVSLEDLDAFFPALNLLTNPTTFEPALITESPETIYVKALQAIKENGILPSIGAMASFERALALRAATPKIQAFHSYYMGRHADTSTPTDCGSWVEWKNGQRICIADDLLLAAGYRCENWVPVKGVHLTCAEGALKRLEAHQNKPQDAVSRLTFDHIYPSAATASTPHLAVLYGSLTSPNFWSLHDTLRSLATINPSAVQYIFRHAPDASASPGLAFLSGYGVGLDLKKTDYLAVDDRQARGASKQGGTQAVLSEDEAPAEAVEDPILSQLPELESPVDLGKPLAEEDLVALGFKTSQLILDSPNPLSTLKHVSQNFPRYATSISHRKNTTDPVVLAIGDNMQKVQSGANMVWLNGRPVDASNMNPFSLLGLMRKERQVFANLESIGLTTTQSIRVLTDDALSRPSENQLMDGMFDASDRPEGGGLIAWINDFEQDERYANWPSTLSSLLQPSYGQMPRVKRNVQNIVVAVDLSKSSTLTTINMLVNLVQRGIPVRFGIVPIVESEEAIQVARVFYYLMDNFEPLQAVGIFAQGGSARRPTMDLQLLRRVYESVTSTESPAEGISWKTFDEVISPFSDNTRLVERLSAYSERLGVTNAESKSGHIFINGKYSSLHDDWLRTVQTEIGQHLQYLQEKLFTGELVDSEDLDVSNFFYDLPMTASRRNRYIYPSSGGPHALRVSPLVDFELPQSFVYSGEPDKLTPLSVWIVGDFETIEAMTMVQEALRAMSGTTSFRLSFVYVPGSQSSASGPPRVSEALMTVAHSDAWLTPDNMMKLLEATQPTHSTAEELKGMLTGLFGKGAELVLNGELDFEEAGKRIAHKLGFAPGDLGIVMNGRVIGPFGKDTFTAEDFLTLASYELSKRVLPVHMALKSAFKADGNENREIPDHMLAEVSSVIAADQSPEPGMGGDPRPRSRPYTALTSRNAAFEIGNNSTAIFHFGIVLNPLSVNAQQYSSLLEWLADDNLVHAIVYLNPPHEVKELPLKRFYRYNLPNQLQFDSSSKLSNAKVELGGLPPDPIYTLAMDVPRSWLVRPRESLHDLDNIQLGTLSESERAAGVEAVFSLDYLVIEGHAQDSVTKAPPRGLQLQLSSYAVPIADTQVVANLGYFQLRAAPGVFQLEIRPGRGREIYEMVSAGNQGYDSPSVEEVGADITVTSFEGVTLYPVFKRLEGMENADVLQEAEQPSAGVFENFASKVGSLFSSSKAKSTTEVIKRQADINIFTVASGLLYERFASIMILSVLKNTDKTVKFWFIENFLSPSFLEFIPHFAAEYNFEYELVTYKWPSWLRMPTEKQRIIWGYKILFLDVLFPMDLKKVIFVDADQIVRADLHELVTLDLEGAPYGYTPMGDDSEDMDGFRFWKQGYWKDHLRGMPYHISALYVIDLVRFRQLAAGDRLRGQYQGLSADPNSLANLDQDLPNNMQREVPIFSLPEDWLWCETWCSKDRLHRAKTIDLCQNPKTKEPKLSRARQIPEWEVYDSEIATFARKLASLGQIHSSAAVEDVNALAGEGAKKPAAGSADPVLSSSGEEVGAPVAGREEL